MRHHGGGRPGLAGEVPTGNHRRQLAFVHHRDHARPVRPLLQDQGMTPEQPPRRREERLRKTGAARMRDQPPSYSKLMSVTRK